jgi:CHAT domain-containing protein/tetratricopeptide (TPR) repeat protein
MALDERHPDAERLAEYADGVLDAEGRAEVERHLADCAECRAVVMETMAFLNSPAITTPVPAPRIIPFRARRWVTGVAVGLAAAAALVLAVRVARPEWVSGLFGTLGDRPELQELIAALANEPTRPVEGRLTGGFKYAPPPSPTRGSGDRDVSPDVRIAAATIEKRVAGRDTPQDEGILSVAHLALGDYDKAIAALEDAVQQAPDNHVLQSDLSAAYLARASRTGRAEDLPRALTAAERAVRARPAFAEAAFNRALALEALHLTEEARAGWDAYLRIDPTSGWAREAERRRAALSKPLARRDYSPAEIIAALRTDPAATLSLIRASERQKLREEIEDRMLPEWAAAMLANDPSAAQRLNAARTLADALSESGGDTMPRDGIQAITRALDGPSPRVLTDLARAHALFGKSRSLFLSSQLQRAAQQMGEAAPFFMQGQSPYAQWGVVYQSIYDRVAGQGMNAVARLDESFPHGVPRGYANLLGRIAWTRGVALATSGRLDVARGELAHALEAYEDAGEVENQAAMQTMLGEVLWWLGARPESWMHHLSALALYHELPVNPRGNVVLLNANFASLGEQMPEAALPFDNTLVAKVEQTRAWAPLAEAYLHRARTLGQLHRLNDARADLQRAIAVLTKFDDPGLKARTAAEIDAATAELEVDTGSGEAVSAATRALRYFAESTYRLRVVRLLRIRGRARAVSGDLDAAEADLRRAIEEFETQRDQLPSVSDRALSFETGWLAFEDLIYLKAVLRRQFDDALSLVERSRARTLVEGNATPGAPAVDTGRFEVPARAVILVSVVLRDRVIVWRLEGRERRVIEIPLVREDLSRQIARFRSAVEHRRDLAAIRQASEPLFRELFEPALKGVAPKTTLVIVPDALLYDVPYGALVQASGRYLVEDYPIDVAPSLAIFADSAQRFRSLARVRDILTVGDGHRVEMAALPALLNADAEARTISKLYPRSVVLTGDVATKSRFLTLAPQHDVIHFSGHAVASRSVPQYSQLLLAPGQDSEAGSLFAYEVASQRLTRTQVVVLASCATAVGAASRSDGPMSLARSFLAAGSGSVIASLWDVKDDMVRSLFTELHQGLAAGLDAADALRLAQVSLIQGSDERAQAPATWAGLLAYGGIHEPSVYPRTP